MKIGDLVRVPYQGLGVVISVTLSTTVIQTLSGKQVRCHPSHVEVVNANR